MIQARRTTIAGLCMLLASAVPALAQYPTKAITVVIPFAAGGGTDAITRIVVEHMAKTLGQPMVVENEGGAGGTTATARAARAAPDGYTILVGHMGTHGAAPAQYPGLKYDPAKDFTPIGQMAGVPMVIVARKDFPASSLKEFVEHVKRSQATVNEAHGGVGSGSHATCTLLQSIMGTKTGRVAYRGVGPALGDLVAGHVDFGCMGLNGVASQIQGGTIKAIAIASGQRANVIKDVPTTKEAGLPEFLVPNWNAIFAPKGLPREIQAKVNDALGKALDDPATRKRLLDLGGEIPTGAERTPESLQKLVESEVVRWSNLLKAELAGTK